MKNISHALSGSAKEEEIEIGIATTPEEKREIYRLRYSIYVKEMSYKLVTVDHANKLLYDDLDEWGTLFYAKFGSELIGTVRVNIGPLSDFSSEVIETYCMDRFQKFYNENENYNFGLVTKGMVSSSYRNLPVFTMLMTKAFEMYCEYQVQFAFVNCKFHLISLMEYFGNRRIDKNIIDPSGGGPLASFVMLVDDVQHLQAVGSPLCHAARKRMSTPMIQNERVVRWFQAAFPKIANIINSRLITEEKFWTILHARLGYFPNEAMPILQGLSEAEAKKFLHRCGVIVQCPKGDYIMTRGDVSQELTVLLSGTLCSSDSPDVNNIIAGQHFGGIGIPNRSKQPLSVKAATDTEILVLSYHYFLKFHKAHPDIACKILENLNQG